MSIVTRLVEISFRVLVVVMRRLHPEWNPRTWSNQELRKFAVNFTGDIVHVSGWKDEDKLGAKYESYFSKAASYTLTNFYGEKGISSESDLFLDLELHLDDALIDRFDVVFNHTTLEHVFDINRAFDNLSRLTSDILILVVPLHQVQHWASDSFSDYHRFTEYGIVRHLESRNFKVLYLNTNNNPVFPTYVFVVASKCAEKWSSIIDGCVSMPDQYFSGVKPLLPKCVILQ